MKKFKYIMIISLALIAVFVLISSSKFAAIQVNPDIDLAPSSMDSLNLLDLKHATVDIFNLNGKHLGRGFMSGERNILVTAAHVIAADCEALSCMDFSLKVASTSDDSKDRVKILLINKLYCSDWLDLCAASTGSDFPRALTNIKWSREREGPYYIELLEQASSGFLKKAEWKRKSPLGDLLKVNVRTGYSGSPVFDRYGGLSGILSSGTETNSFFAPAFVIAYLLGFENIYLGETYTIAADDIQEVLKCKALAESSCFALEAKILTKRFLLLASHPDDWEFFLQGNSKFWSEWKSELQSFKTDETFSELWLLSALNSYYSLEDKIQQEALKGLILKRLELQDESRYRFVREKLVD